MMPEHVQMHGKLNYQLLRQPRVAPCAMSSDSANADVNTTASSTQLPDASVSSVKWPG